ncbi:MAG: transporter [Helicobacteraceae bacterium]|nr:transporter [Helicobacteraceae bacterium]
MNILVAKVINIESVDSLNIVNFTLEDQNLSMMSLDLDENVKVGVEVELSMNPSHVAIAKEFSGTLSYSNQLKAKIVSLENGELLSSVKLLVNGSELESIITLNSSKKMNLQVGDNVTLLIKASELSILRVL